MTAPHLPAQNRLIAALSQEDFDSLAAHLTLVALRVGEPLYEPRSPLKQAYFPTTAIVSLRHVLKSGESAQSASVGDEGVVGISIFLGGDATPSTATVQIAGHAYRLAPRLLKQQFDLAGPMQRVLLRYTHALMNHMAQTALCYRHHTVEQQLCRCLLITLDRLRWPELVMTQELLAGMLGVRRESVTEAAGRLQHAGFIRYRRGHIAVLDRPGLETRACECYSVMKNEFSRLGPELIVRENCSAPTELSCSARAAG